MGGYAITPGQSRTIAWDENNQYTNSGIGTQTLVTIDLPAGTFSKGGQTVMIEFWGDITNTTGETYCLVSFDGNDCVGNVHFALPANAQTRGFYFKGMVTCIDPADTFVQEGIAVWSRQDNGTTVTDILTQNGGGNPVPDAHQILFNCEGQGATVTMNVTVNHFLVTFLQGGQVNYAP
jgi:hypothetical protein